MVAQDYMMKLGKIWKLAFMLLSVCWQTSASFMCAVFEMIAFCIEKPKLYSLTEV